MRQHISFAFCLTSRGRLCLDRMSSCSLIGLSHGGGWGCVCGVGDLLFFHMKDQLLTFHLSYSNSPLPRPPQSSSSHTVFNFSVFFKNYYTLIILLMQLQCADAYCNQRLSERMSHPLLSSTFCTANQTISMGMCDASSTATTEHFHSNGFNCCPFVVFWL